MFFGIHCILLGILIYRSGYLPKLLGMLLAIAGLIYVADSLADIAVPICSQDTHAIFVFGFVAELSLCLGLLTKGVNISKWEEKAHRFAT